MLLVGLAVALSAARSTRPAAARSCSTRPTRVAAVRPGRARERRLRPGCRRCSDGRALGLAVVILAGGALIDQANGGRLHPEQWLGAAAAVCGVGLLVGTVIGRAHWLAIPAVLFAGAGVVVGESARLGLHPTALTGDHYIDVSGGTTTDARRHVVLGSVDVQIVGAPSRPITVDARVAIGDVDIHVPDDLTVEVRAHGGDVTVDGVGRDDGTFTVGPEGPPDVVVDARVGYGDIDVDHWTPGVPVLDLPQPPIVAAPAGTLRDLADGVAMTHDGSIALAGGEALVDPTGRIVVGESHREGNVTVITTSNGDFKLLPGDLLLTPIGELLDLTAAHASVPVPPTTEG